MSDPLTEKASDLSDDGIVRQLQTNYDRELFGILFDRYSGKVYSTCLSMVGENNTADDLTHDIFLKLLWNLKKFDFRSSFSTWLYRIATNFCIDYIRNHRRMKIKEVDYAEELERSRENDNEKELLSMKAKLLIRVLEQLKPEEKLILLLKYQEDKSIREITELIGISESAVKMRLKRSKAKAVVIKREMEVKHDR